MFNLAVVTTRLACGRLCQYNVFPPRPRLEFIYDSGKQVVQSESFLEGIPTLDSLTYVINKVLRTVLEVGRQYISVFLNTPPNLRYF